MAARDTSSDLVVARAIREAVHAVAGVAGVGSDRSREAATYGPGEVVPGVVVRRTDDALEFEVHAVARYSRALALPVLAERIRDAVRAKAGELQAGPVRRIDVVFDDLRIDEGWAG